MPEEGLHLHGRVRTQAHECGAQRRFCVSLNVWVPEDNPKRRCAPHSKALRARAGIVVLAAGGSSRLGTPKQLLQFRGKSLIRHAAETAVASGLGPVVVVLGAHAEALAVELDGLDVAIVDNRDWRRGIGSSIRAGVGQLTSAGAFVTAILLTLCDQPLVTSEDLRRLAARHAETHAPIVACAYGDTLGVPALFDVSLADELSRIPAERGAKDLIASFGSKVASVHVPAAAMDVDTAIDYVRLLSSPELVTEG